MTRKSGLSGEVAAASMTSSGLRNSPTEGICLFLSLSLKRVFSPAIRAILGYSGGGKEGDPSLPDINSSNISRGDPSYT